jgi:hypothetical protein
MERIKVTMKRAVLVLIALLMILLVAMVWLDDDDFIDKLIGTDLILIIGICLFITYLSSDE